MFPVWLQHFLTLSTLQKEMGTVEKEGGLTVLDNDNLFIYLFIYSSIYFFLQTAQIISRLPAKICAKWLILFNKFPLTPYISNALQMG